MISRRRVLAAVTAAAITAASGCTGSTGESGDDEGATIEETSDVQMTDSQFQPRNIQIDAGTTVTWTNEDSVEHTVTSASDNWSKDTSVPGGEQTTHTFEDSGVYDVYCSIHGSSDLSGMSMKVGVGDATIESPLGGGETDGGGGYY